MPVVFRSAQVQSNLLAGHASARRYFIFFFLSPGNDTRKRYDVRYDATFE